MKNIVVLIGLILSTSCNWASDFSVVLNNTSGHAIVTPNQPTTQEANCAKALQQYIHLATGVSLFVTTENAWKNKPAFYIGNTKKAKELNLQKITGEGYHLKTTVQDVFIVGGTGKGLTYGTYAFIEKFLNGIKLSEDIGQVMEVKLWELPQNFSQSYTPPFVYREVFYPQSSNAEYLQWHGLHQFETLWGLWGHSYFKLVSPKQYFKTNPEYFALENGVRKPTQLCPTNTAVIKIAIATLEKLMADNPDAEYWSLSAEDDLGYCHCKNCDAINKKEQTAAGAHLFFVNEIAKQFPTKQFTTLAYTYTLKAPLHSKPRPNVFVMLSTIDAYHNQPLETEPSAASFRNALLAWEQKTSQIFVWDYTTQFTNYLAPFPDVFNLGANIKYFAKHHVKGVFSQGSGYTHGELAELRSYLIAKLLWNPELDDKQLIEQFCKDYYKAAAPFVLEYLNLIHAEAKKSNRKIDIYGQPINEHNSYLTPVLLDQYSTLFDKAEGAVEESEKLLNRIYKLRLSFDYVFLQQAKFFGTEKHGIFQLKDGTLDYEVNPKMIKKVEKFVTSAELFKVTELSEGGLSPQAYLTEWNKYLAKGWQLNLAFNKPTKLTHPYVEEYPAKGNKTLTDCVTGLTDFSYNWLGFYGTDMIAEIDLESEKEVSVVKFNFLDDPRHWIFLPNTTEVSISMDGKTFTPLQPNGINITNPDYVDEYYTAKVVKYEFNHKPQMARYIRVVAKNRNTLPEWRYRPNKKPMLACDEIFIQ